MRLLALRTTTRAESDQYHSSIQSTLNIVIMVIITLSPCTTGKDSGEEREKPFNCTSFIT
jgi:hypothetical protein